MSIAVTCADCFETCKVKEQFRGTRIRCKACGASILVVDHDEFAARESKPRPGNASAQKSGRAKRRESSPLSSVASSESACWLAGGIWFAVTKLNSKTNNGLVDEKDYFAKPPSDPRVKVTNQEWKPDNEIANTLGRTYTFGDYEMRVR